MRTLILLSGPVCGKATNKSTSVSGPAHFSPQHVMVQTASAQVLIDLSTPLHLTQHLFYVLNTRILILKPMDRCGVEREWEVGEMLLNPHEDICTVLSIHLGRVSVF